MITRLSQCTHLPSLPLPSDIKARVRSVRDVIHSTTNTLHTARNPAGAPETVKRHAILRHLLIQTSSFASREAADAAYQEIGKVGILRFLRRRGVGAPRSSLFLIAGLAIQYGSDQKGILVIAVLGPSCFRAARRIVRQTLVPLEKWEGG